MDCDKFVKYIKEWKNPVCIFGAGNCGTTWGYELVKHAGFKEVFYCDNNCAGQDCNGYPVYSPDYLYDKNENVLCLIAVMGENGSIILNQLHEIGMKHIIWIADGNPEVELPQYLDDNHCDEIKQNYSYLTDDKKYLERLYLGFFSKPLDFDNPQTFNEKLQWLKIFDRQKHYTQMVDKFEAKGFAEKVIGDKYIIPLFGAWDCFDDIDFDSLPKSFVLKCTHDSGGIAVVRDKSNMDYQLIKNRFEKCLKRNFFYVAREWPYKGVKPRIIAEELIDDGMGNELNDYKFFCFHGEPRIIQVDFDRFSNHKRNLYDVNWNYLDVQLQYPTDKSHLIDCPNGLQEMIHLAKKLTRNIPFARTDFYYVNRKIYFGEITLYPGAGFEVFHPEKWDYTLGSWLDLNKIG